MFINNECKTPDILMGITVTQSESSLIVIAKKEIILPEKKVATIADMTEEERQILHNMGLI